MARGGRLLEQLEGPGVVARRALDALGEDQREAMRALGRASIGGVLQGLHGLARVAAIEQHGTEPGLGIGIARRQPPQRGFGGRQITGAIGQHCRAQRRRDVRRVERLRPDGCRRDEQRRQQHPPRTDHLVLKL